MSRSNHHPDSLGNSRYVDTYSGEESNRPWASPTPFLPPKPKLGILEVLTFPPSSSSSSLLPLETEHEEPLMDSLLCTRCMARCHGTPFGCACCENTRLGSNPSYVLLQQTTGWVHLVHNRAPNPPPWPSSYLIFQITFHLHNSNPLHHPCQTHSFASTSSIS